ncbi:ANKRD44 [Symbiodinium sp. CCMP2592]|nr:ANKRD44 [Symbiodinium sp. CCMP2592]
MIGLHFRTEDGRLLADVHNFLERFESYALQRSMGQQLYEYAFPCTFLVPFLAEPLAVIFAFSRIFMLLIRSHPEVKPWVSRSWLAALDLELGRYADCLVNVFLAVLVFFFPGGYTHWVFALLAICHAYIYVYDHYRVLRVVPRVVIHSMSVDFCAQVLLAPACGILLVCLIFKGNCSKNALYCVEAEPLLWLCLGAFLLHCAVHALIICFVVPCWVGRTRSKEKVYRKDAKSFKDVAAEEPCSWFTANPIHCLRSSFVYHNSPPCSFYTPGMEHTMQVNESIGCHFTEVDETVEDVHSYLQLPRLPTLRDLKHILDNEEDDGATGDTGCTAHRGCCTWRRQAEGRIIKDMMQPKRAQRMAEFDLPCTRPMNQIRGFESETKETQRAARTRDALRQLGAKKDLLNLDSYLLDRPEAVNMPVLFDQGSLLHVAAMRGHQDMVQMLIHQRGADVERTNYAQQTSLHAACDGNHANIVVDLLAAGADADKRDALRQTPLHRAAHVGAVDCLLALLEYGANAKLRDDGGLLPVHTAAFRGRDEVLRVLISQEPTSANAEAADGWTPLHFASHGGHVAATEALLECGAYAHSVDKDKRTALHCAAASGSEATCQALLRAGADLECMDQHKKLPIHVACEEGCIQVVRFLLDAGSPFDTLDCQRRTPLLIATRAGNLELCEVLLSAGADPNTGDMARGIPSALALARRGTNPALRGLIEEYARAAAAASAAMPLADADKSPPAGNESKSTLPEA